MCPEPAAAANRSRSRPADPKSKPVLSAYRPPPPAAVPERFLQIRPVRASSFDIVRCRAINTGSEPRAEGSPRTHEVVRTTQNAETRAVPSAPTPAGNRNHSAKLSSVARRAKPVGRRPWRYQPPPPEAVPERFLQIRPVRASSFDIVRSQVASTEPKGSRRTPEFVRTTQNAETRAVPSAPTPAGTEPPTPESETSARSAAPESHIQDHGAKRRPERRKDGVATRRRLSPVRGSRLRSFRR